MPVIPKTQFSTVQNDALPTPQTNAAAFGGQQDQQLQQVGGSVAGFGQDVLNKSITQQNELSLANTRDVASQFQNALLDDVQQNVLTKQGKDALGATKDLQDRISTMRSNYAASLTNPAQQALFGRLSDDAVGQATRMSRSHETQQGLAYTQQSATAQKASFVNASIAAPLDEDAATNTLAAIYRSNATLYKGFPDEETAANATDVNHWFQGRVGAIGKSDPATALAFAEKHKDAFDGGTYDAITKSMRDQVVVQSSQRAADQLTGLPPAAAYQALSGMQDGPMKDMTKQLIDSAFTAQAHGKAKQLADSDASLTQAMIQDYTMAPSMIPQNYPIDQRVQLTSTLNKLAENPPVTDSNVYRGLLQGMTQNPNAFMRMPLTPYIDKLSPDDMNTILNLRSEIEKKVQAHPGDQVSRGPLNVEGVFNDAIKVGIPDPGFNTPPSPSLSPILNAGQKGTALATREGQISELRGLYYDRVNQELPTAADRSPENLKKIANGLIADRVVNKGWFGTSVGQTTAPAGLVDLHPENYPNAAGIAADAAAPKGVPDVLKGHPNVSQYTGANGQNVYYHYNADGTQADVYDAKGNLINHWRKQ